MKDDPEALVLKRRRSEEGGGSMKGRGFFFFFFFGGGGGGGEFVMRSVLHVTATVSFPARSGAKVGREPEESSCLPLKELWGVVLLAET